MEILKLQISDSSESMAGTVTDLFHCINDILPEDQQLLTVQRETLASSALELMERNGYSQLPVLIETEVIGIFSYRSFSRSLLEFSSGKGNLKGLLAELTVDECCETIPFARVMDELRSCFDALNVHDAILVGEAHLLIGIVTPVDVIRYLDDVSKPFILVAEIETSLRALIRKAVTAEKLAECASTALSKQYAAEQVPTSLDAMTFHEYVQIIGDGRNWPFFEPFLRGSRDRTRPKLEAMNKLRNDVFHLRELNDEARKELSRSHEWMKRLAKAIDFRSKKGTA